MNNKSYNIIKISVLVVIAITLTIITVLLLINKNVRSKFFFDIGGDYELVFSNEYEVSEINKLSFDLISADLDVEYSNNDKIKLEIYDKKEKNVSVNITDGVLDVSFSRFKTFCFGFCSISRRAKLYLPKDYNGSFDIKSASGDIFIDDYENISGYIKTISGEVEIRKVDKVNVKTTSGDVTILSANSVEVISTSGELVLRNIPDLKFETTSGEIEVSNVNNVVGSTISGEFEAININGSVEFNSTSGDVDLERVTLGKNSSISTVSGDVEVKLVNPVNIDVTTISGDKDIYNIDRNSDITLKISTTSGDIEVN